MAQNSGTGQIDNSLASRPCAALNQRTSTTSNMVHSSLLTSNSERLRSSRQKHSDGRHSSNRRCRVARRSRRSGASLAENRDNPHMACSHPERHRARYSSVADGDGARGCSVFCARWAESGGRKRIWSGGAEVVACAGTENEGQNNKYRQEEDPTREGLQRCSQDSAIEIGLRCKTTPKVSHSEIHTRGS